MGRRPADKRLDNLKESLLEKIASETDPNKLKDWLSCYKVVVTILEEQERKRLERKKQKLAMPRV